MSNSKKKSLSGNAVQKNPGKEQSASSIRKWMGIIPILILTYLVYTPALKNSITGWDDNNYITENKDIRQLNTDFIKKSFAPHSGYVMGNYHPLTMISYALEYKSGKLNPKTFHTTNVLLHLINGALVYLFIWLLSGRMLVSSITAALFLLHPMHVESVAWISERKDLLYCMFEMAALSAYIVYIKKKKNIWLLLCFGLFLLAILSKAMAVAMVALLPLLDYYFNRKLSSPKAILEKIPFLITGIIFGLIAIEAQKEFEAFVNEIRPITDRFLLAAFSFITYLWKSILPINLSTYYDYPPIGTYSWYFVFILLTIVLFALAFWSIGKTKKILFGFLFFSFSIVLVLQFLPVGGAILAERYTYIPYIGIFFLIAEGISYLNEKRNTGQYKYLFPIAVTSMFLFFLFITVSTHSRCKVWKDTVSIWDDALLQNPSCVKAYGGRGNGYNDKQMYQQAIQDLNKAIELKTDYADAYYNRGLAYYFIAKQNQDAGKSDDASRYYSLSIQDNSEAIKYKPNLARAYYNRSGNYFILKQFDLALTDVLKSKELGMEVDPAYIEFLKKQMISK